MTDFGTVQSTVKPENIEVKDTAVFVASDIKENIVTSPEDNEIHIEYEYNLIRYDKNEYIKTIQEQNESLTQQVTDAQMALCDLYETMGE